MSAHETFIEADEEVISGFSALGVSAIPSRETIALIEKIVYQMYAPKMVPTVKELRWWLFRKKQAHSDSKATTNPSFPKSSNLKSSLSTSGVE